MGGGLMQLVAYGAQDVYLTGNPLITFFKVIYRRHTNFAVESIEQTFNGSADFTTADKKVTCTISRNGDLISHTYLQVTLPTLGANFEYVNSVGHAMIKTIELEIGGQKIDKWYSDAFEYWQELTLPSEKEVGYSAMTGKGASSFATGNKGGTFYVPLQFFFNRNIGLALPLIALQYHEVKLHIEFRKLTELVNYTASTDVENIGEGTGLPTTSSAFASEPEATVYVDYIYLDTDERRRFAQVQHEMLIEQLQFTGDESLSAATADSSHKIKMNFNHPVKELVWMVQEDNATDTPGARDYFKYSSGATAAGDLQEPIKKAKIMLNGHDRFSERDGSYFRLVQPYQCHTRVPKKNIYVYSFALRPEEHQPSGTCNFSRIDNATLSLVVASGTTASKLKIFAHSYNVLRIMSGMGGLAFSN